MVKTVYTKKGLMSYFVEYIFIFSKNSNLLIYSYEAFVVGESLCPQLLKEELKDVKAFLDRYSIEGIKEGGDIEHKFNALYTNYVNNPSWAMGRI